MLICLLLVYSSFSRLRRLLCIVPQKKEEQLESSVTAGRFAHVSVLLNHLPSRHYHGGVLNHQTAKSH